MIPALFITASKLCDHTTLNLFVILIIETNFPYDPLWRFYFGDFAVFVYKYLKLAQKTESWLLWLLL